MDTLLDSARPVLDAVMSGHYVYAAALALVVLVAALRKHGADWSPKYLSWTRTDWGSPLLVLLASFAGALATALAAGAAPSLAIMSTALGVAVTAAGGFKMAKELVAPLLRAVRSRLPAKLQPLVSLLLWVFDKPDRAAEAKAAGDAAVKASPPTGAAGVVGAPREVE